MAIGIDGREKIRYAEGGKVVFSFDGFKTVGTGKVRGLAMEHVIDFWIVEVEEWGGMDRKDYPWSCVSIPNSSMRLY